VQLFSLFVLAKLQENFFIPTRVYLKEQNSKENQFLFSYTSSKYEAFDVIVSLEM